MQNTVVGVFVAATVAVIVSFVVVSFNEPGEAVSSPDVAILASLEDRLKGIEEQLAASADLESRIALLEQRRSGGRSVARERPVSPASDGESGDETNSALAKAAAAEAAVLGAGEEGAEGSPLRTFVAGVIREERKQREVNRQREAQARQREHEEMQKGPWGRHNFQVNKLAKKLDLDDRQKQYYYDTLIHYSDRMAERRKRLDWKNKSDVKDFRAFSKELNSEFENAVAVGLDADQAEDFRDLPAWERGQMGGGDLRFSSVTSLPTGTAVFGLGGLETEVHQAVSRVIVSDENAAGNVEIRTTEAIIELPEPLSEDK